MPLDKTRIEFLHSDDSEIHNMTARADEVVERAQLNEALRIINGLEEEVASMVIAERFSRTKKPSEGAYGKFAGSRPDFHNATEEEYKRAQLLLNLRQLKDAILHNIAQLKRVVLDIEATKR